MAPWGVDVSVMEPGNYATAMSDPILVRAEVVRLWRGLSVEMRREYGQESFDRCKYKTCTLHKDSTNSHPTKLCGTTNVS